MSKSEQEGGKRELKSTWSSSPTVTFLDLCRVHFSFSTCLLSFSHHMTNHPSISITWLVTWPTHMTSHMPFQSPAPQSHLFYVTCSQVTCTSPDTPSPDLTWPYPYPWFVSVRLPQPRFWILGPLTILSSWSLTLQLILTPFLLPSRVSQFHSIWLHLLSYDSLLVQVLVVLCLSHTASSHVYKPSCFPRVGP